MRKVDFLAAAGTCKARFGPTPGITEGNFCNSILGRGTFTTECLRVRLLFFCFLFFLVVMVGQSYRRLSTVFELVSEGQTAIFLVLMVGQSCRRWSTVFELVSVGQTAGLLVLMVGQSYRRWSTVLELVSVDQAAVFWSLWSDSLAGDGPQSSN